MSKTKALMRKQVDDLYTRLSSFNIPVFEDEIAEDEERDFADTTYHCFVYETLAMRKMDDMKSVNQAIVIYYYSENRDDLDEYTIDIIQTLSSIIGVKFERSTKQRLQKKDTDRFIDRIILTFSRRIVMECPL